MQAYLQSVEKVSSFVMADDVKKIVRGCCIFCNNRRVALICGGGQSAIIQRKNEVFDMNFGQAIEAIKEGKKAARKGWNGKNQYIQLATGISYKSASGEIVNCEHDAIGNKAIAFVGTSGVQMGWLASQADMLAEDWVIVE